MSTLRRGWLVAFASLFVWLAPPTLAQQPPSRIAATVGAALRVDGFDVEQVAQLAPGTPLVFSLYGTAGGILGAVGGAVVGNEIERQRSKRTRYEVVVRLADGATQVRRFDAPPPWRVGDRLRVADGGWTPDAPAGL